MPIPPGTTSAPVLMLVDGLVDVTDKICAPNEPPILIDPATPRPPAITNDPFVYVVDGVVLFMITYSSDVPNTI